MNILIRSYLPSDLDRIQPMISETIAKVNSKDYSEIQIEKWITKLNSDPIDFAIRLQKQICFVAEIDKNIVGFASMDLTGYIDLFYVHHNYLRNGIGSYLYTRLELEAEELNLNGLSTKASITAMPFFLRKGFGNAVENIVDIEDVSLTNYVLEKKL